MFDILSSCAWHIMTGTHFPQHLLSKSGTKLVSSTEIVIVKKQFEIGKVVEINWGVVV
jgi:hypothetical protein